MKFLFALLIFTMLNVLQSFAQDLDSNLVLKYLIRKPLVETKSPKLLLFLHGVGSNEQDLFTFAPKIPADFLVVSARAPFVLGENSFAWYHVDFSTGKPVFNLEEEEKSRLLLIEFINQLAEKHDIDKDSICLAGFSQGAIMSYSVALTSPQLISGIAIFSGRLLEEIKPQIQLQNLNKLNVFISHGKQDPTLPLAYAQSADLFLKSVGLMPELHEYTAKHEITAAMFLDFLTWLDKIQK